MTDDRIINGVRELKCWTCKEWKPLDNDSWAFFPEEQHECRKCYDANQAFLEMNDAENEAKRDFIANGGSPDLTGY